MQHACEVRDIYPQDEMMVVEVVEVEVVKEENDAVLIGDEVEEEGDGAEFLCLPLDVGMDANLAMRRRRSAQSRRLT